MKVIFNVIFAVFLFLSNENLQAKIQSVPPLATTPSGSVAVDELKPFDQFFKKTMKVTEGGFPVYQDGGKYYLEISPDNLNADILVLGDVARGYANNIAQSSGILRLSVGTGNNLNVTKAVYKEAASPDFNQGIEELVQRSNLIPISFVIPAVAAGKVKGSYIIDITKQITESGDLFSFKDVSSLSNPDPTRSGVQQVVGSSDAVVFSVLRTQTIPGQSINGSKAIDKAAAFVLNLIIQRLPNTVMEVREADLRIGFKTVNYNDFGKSPYGIRNVKVINKWNLEVADKDRKKYNSGTVVEPKKAVKVFIDPTTPSIFVPYIKKAVQQWNAAFQTAGFKNALVVVSDDKESWLGAGKILIKWGNAANGMAKNTVVDPRTGEILVGKLNIDAGISDNLLASYFAKCGFKDPRIMKNLYDPEVRGEIMEWRVAQGLGELFGMVPNLHGSAAYTTAQLRSGTWLKDHGFTSSVTDETEFNYVVQPEDQIAVADLMPKVAAYDKLAIGWAYRIFKNTEAAQKVLSALKVSDPVLLFVEENKSDPYTRKGDLGNNHLEAAKLGMKNVQTFYPQLEKLTAKMTDKDEDWRTYKQLAKAYQISYQLYTDNVLSCIGGKSSRPVLKQYNDQAVSYPSKKDQQEAMALLNSWFFNGAPTWMQSDRMNQLSEESETMKMNRSSQDALRKLISPDVINNLLQAEYALGKEAYTVSDLFKDIDHYVFKDFSTTGKVDDYTMLTQKKFMFDLATAVAKNNIVSGLTDSSEVLHHYFVRTLKHLGELAEQHQDTNASENYKVIKQKIERDINQKQN